MEASDLNKMSLDFWDCEQNIWCLIFNFIASEKKLQHDLVINSEIQIQLIFEKRVIAFDPRRTRWTSTQIRIA